MPSMQSISSTLYKVFDFTQAEHTARLALVTQSLLLIHSIDQSLQTALKKVH